MKFLKKAAFCYIAPILSLCGLITAPLDAQSCDPAPCCIDWCSLFIPAVIGAAAGAGAAAAIKNRGKHGKRGEEGQRGIMGPQGERGNVGPAGANPFVNDLFKSLDFKFQINSISFVGNIPGSIIPYISTPDGRVYTLQPFNLVNTVTPTSTLITVGEPPAGSYVVGFEFPPLTAPVTIDYDIIITPSSSGRSPTEFSGTATAPISGAGNEAQLGFDYVYGPKGTVP